MSNLNDAQLKNIGKKLDGIIFKKEYPSPMRDYVKAAVLFHDLYNKGIVLTMDDVNRAIKLAKSQFSEEMIKIMGYFAETFYLMKEGLQSPFRDSYRMTEELEKNS